MRSYDQFCPAALALDLVGERWTLLIVRELGVRPMRYGELRRGLPGIATNLLADRLEALVAAAVVSRSEPGPVYDLTDWGRELYEIVLRLGRWGARLLPTAPPAAGFQGHYLVSPVRALYDLDADLSGVPDVAVRLTGPEPVRVEVRRGRLDVGLDAGGPVDVTIGGPPDALLPLLAGVLPLDEAAARGVTIDGPDAARAALAALVERAVLVPPR